ncbi:hypothetical protein L2E82_16272 [Cichorium intybus]|uniref:Uncharacterized protein n=1 Tax=Cichorium intybus TaxID=13427 RepID=A0ACB9F5R2_CICIN|nr:hypothetical protein L2E82_16272 [Cichorium intybus]
MTQFLVSKLQNLKSKKANSYKIVYDSTQTESPPQSLPPRNNTLSMQFFSLRGLTGTKRRSGPGGLNKLCGITPELQVIVGESALSRTDIVKQLWAYIKKKQPPRSQEQEIICDDALRVVLETDCTDMFKMNKLLAKHIIRLEPTKESSRKKSKVNVEPVVEDTNTYKGCWDNVVAVCSCPSACTNFRCTYAWSIYFSW